MGKKILIRCPNCQYEGAGVRKGSFWVELAFWALFGTIAIASGIVWLLPALGYTVWRMFNLGLRCPRCDFKHVVKVGPMAE